MNSLITESLKQELVHLLMGFPKVLLADSEKRMVEWIENYVMRFGKTPTLTRFEGEFDTFVSQDSQDPLADIYEQTLTKKRNIYTRQYMTEIQDKLKKGADPLPFIEQLHEHLRSGSGDVSRYTSYDRSMYLRKPTTFPYEIPQLDRYTGGIGKGDLIYLIGRLGVGKTSVALWIVGKSLLQGRRILMVSNENRADDVIAKVDSFIGGFNPIKKRTMEWTEEDKNRLNTVSFIAKNMDGEMFIPNLPVKDVKELRSLVYTYRPDLVIVDGIYLMSGASGDSHWEKITSISRDLKNIAESEGVPIIGIHQANRSAIGKRIEVEHIAYADALAQDADLVMGINPEDDGSLFVEAIKSRWGKDSWGFYLRIFFDTMTVRVQDARLELKADVTV